MDRRHFEKPSSFGYFQDDLTSALPASHKIHVRVDSRTGRGQPKRRHTLEAIIDALNELRNVELDTDSGDEIIPVEDESEGFAFDREVQATGAESFNHFQKRVRQLDKELQNLINAVRQLGSSVGILFSSHHLRQRLTTVLYLFRENAADLFPLKVQHEQREFYLSNGFINRRTQSHATKEYAMPNMRPTVQDNLAVACLPEELKLLANDITIFLECLNEFPAFRDEGVNVSILAFERDIKYWASCMREFEGQFCYPAVKRYVHDLSAEMGSHIEAITSSVACFIEVGVPTIRFAQNHAATNLLNLSTVATFFSAVTATTMQYSFDQVDGPLQIAVNSFWFSSLVFSIASAVNSLLGLTWKQTMYRSPRDRVPWWVLIWITRSPLIFLVASIAAFNAGLVLFTWSSHQHIVTCILIAVFTGFNSFGLTVVCVWFISERITYSRHGGKRWLADILSDVYVDIRKSMDGQWEILPRHTAQARSWSEAQINHFVQRVGVFFQASKRIFCGLRPGNNRQNLNGKGQKPTVPMEAPMACTLSPMCSCDRDTASNASASNETTQVRIDPSTTMVPTPSEAPENHGEVAVNTNATTTIPQQMGKTRFVSAVRSVIMLRNATRALDRSPRDALYRRNSSGPLTTAKFHQLIMLSHTLKNMENSETLPAHHALVRHMQFSPNGKWLVTCSWDRTSVIFKVGHGSPFTPHRTLAHPEGFVRQVAWAPKGGHLLTKLQRSVKIWTEDGVCVKTIECHKTVCSVTWLPNGNEFLVIEGSEVNKLNLTGKILDSYRLPRLLLHDLAVSPDEALMFCVATLIESPDGLQPHKARKERRIVVYNMTEKTIEYQVPVVHNVRDITTTSEGHLVLVSFEDKAPPQLWRLDRANNEVRLSLRRTYMPMTDVDFVGTSCFCAKDDQLILSAGKNGHIHIWDRESATLLHHLRAPDGDLTGIAWNTASGMPMFATGSHDGAVKIWTSIPQQRSPPIHACRLVQGR